MNENEEQNPRGVGDESPRPALESPQEQIALLDQVSESVEPIWKAALAARNRADDALHAIRELKMQIYEKKNELLKQALKDSQEAA